MITSAANQKIKNIQNLLKKGKARREEGVIVVEGRKMFIEVLTQFKDRIKEAYFTEEAFGELKGNFESELSGINYELVAEDVFSKMSETVTPQGVIAIVSMPGYELKDLYGECARVLILDDLRDPGNMGTIIRTAEAAGITGILMSKETVDVTNPKVVRSTMGALLRMPLYYAESLIEAIKSIKADKPGMKVYATELKASKPYNEVSYGQDYAMVIGNEAHGVSEEVLSASDQNIIIPMAGKVESLNAAVAAAVVMFKARE